MGSRKLPKVTVLAVWSEDPNLVLHILSVIFFPPMHNAFSKFCMLPLVLYHIGCWAELLVVIQLYCHSICISNQMLTTTPAPEFSSPVGLLVKANSSTRQAVRPNSNDMSEFRAEKSLLQGHARRQMAHAPQTP